MRIKTRRRAGRRRGVVMLLVLLFVAPILLLFTFAIVEIYMLVTAREELLAASRLGARVAACGECATKEQKEQVQQEVDKTVHRALGSGRLGSAKVHVAWPEELTAQDTAGEADWVRVSLELPMRNAAPDLLGWVGASLGKSKMVVATTMKQE